MSEDWVALDGAMGGGQVLRSSLSLSVLTGKALRLRNIRGRRARPGLMRQHLTAVKAAAEICGAKVQGAELGSLALTFEPGPLQAGDYHFAVGSAGSACLVLQTVLLPLVLARGRSTVVVEGGTHNPLAPPFDFLAESFLPVLARMGAKVEARLVRSGYFPAGGGRIEVVIEPTTALLPLEMMFRDKEVTLRAEVRSVNLPGRISQRQVHELHKHLGLAPEHCTVSESDKGPGPGNVIFVRAKGQRHTEVFSGFGERGVTSVQIVKRLAREVSTYMDSDAPVGVHLADQLLLPMALAGGGSFRTVGVSDHARTNMEVIQRFLDVDFEASRQGRGDCTVVCKV